MARRFTGRRLSHDFILAVGAVFALFILLFTLPFFFAWKEKYKSPPARLLPFTVTVDPAHKKIIEDPAVEATLSPNAPALSAAVLSVSGGFEDLSAAMSQSSVYGMLASAGAPNFVVIEPGLRKEEVAAAFGSALDWNKAAQDAFLKAHANPDGSIPEGNFSPGLYAIETGATGAEADVLTAERFKNQILARYGTSTQEIVPIDEALNIASMIQRETGDKEEMRLI